MLTRMPATLNTRDSTPREGVARATEEDEQFKALQSEQIATYHRVADADASH